MGPKKDDKKGKKKGKKDEPPDPEFVTNLMRTFFELTMADIEKKTERMRNIQVNLGARKIELEEQIVEYQKEKDEEIAELNRIMEEKEVERVTKRDHMYWLVDEIKLRYQQYNDKIKEMEEEYDRMYEQLTAELEELEEELRKLRHFKNNRPDYDQQLVDKQEELQARERQHQRNLYNMELKFKKDTGRLKSEIGANLMIMSTEFQEVTESKIEPTTQRLIQENIAIENELKAMRVTLEEYQEGYDNAQLMRRNSEQYQIVVEVEKDKCLGRIMIQVDVIVALLEDYRKLVEKLASLRYVEIENEQLMARLKELQKEMDERRTELKDMRARRVECDHLAMEMSVNGVALKKTANKLQVLLRNAIRVVDEAITVAAIPVGVTEEEQVLPWAEKRALGSQRRESAFKRKGRMLKYLLDILLKAHEAQSDVDLGVLLGVDFEEGSSEGPEEEEERLIVSINASSLPRFLSSETIIPVKVASSEEDIGEEESVPGSVMEFYGEGGMWEIPMKELYVPFDELEGVPVVFPDGDFVEGEEPGAGEGEPPAEPAPEPEPQEPQE